MMKVLAKPAFSNRSRNPYNYLLYSHLQEGDNIKVEEFAPDRAFAGRWDILHMHWPEVMLSDQGAVRSAATVSAFLVLVRWMKLRGTRLVWTTHNLKSHDYSSKNKANRQLEDWYMNRFTALVDGVIGLSGTSIEEAIGCYPALSDKKRYVIPHGHYKGQYPDTVDRESARSKIGVDEDQFLVGYFGQIRPYKNVPRLVAAFREMDRPDCDLWIAGNPAGESLEAAIRESAGSSDRIRLDLEFIPDEQVQYVMRAVDLLVIPYRRVLNSGSALLALSFDTPVLVPDMGSMSDLRQEVGPEWVHTFSGELTSEVLAEAVAQVRSADLRKCEAIERFGWNRIAEQTAEAYRDLLAE